MPLIETLAMIKSTLDLVKSGTELGESIIGYVKKSRNKIRELWSTGDNRYYSNRRFEIELGVQLYNKYVRSIILHGLSGYGKTMFLETLKSHLICEYYDFSDEKQKIILEKTNAAAVLNDTNVMIPDKPAIEDIFVIIDNVDILDQAQFSAINHYAGDKKRVIVACREHSLLISAPQYIKSIDCSKITFTCRKELKKKIALSLRRALPKCLRIPLIYSVLSNDSISHELNKNKDLLNDLIVMCKNGNDYDYRTFRNMFFDVLFRNIKKQEMDLLTLYAIVMGRSNYNKDVLEVLFRQLDMNTFKNIPAVKKGYIINEHVVSQIHSLLFNKYSCMMNRFQLNETTEKVYMHGALVEYFFERYNSLSMEGKVRFLNHENFITVIANLNWKLASNKSKPFDEKIEYISYSHNTVKFCLDQIDLLTHSYFDIRQVKNLLHLFNSYTYIYVKISSAKQELNRMYDIHKIIHQLMDNEKIQKNWSKNIGQDSYYTSKLIFYNVNAKICLSLSVAGSQFIIEYFEEAVHLMDKYYENINNISDQKQRRKREENYYYTMAMLMYKASLFYRSLINVEIGNKVLTNSGDFLMYAKEYILKSKEISFNYLKEMLGNPNLEFENYNFSPFNEIKGIHLGQDYTTSYLLTLRLESIIRILICNDIAKRIESESISKKKKQVAKQELEKSRYTTRRLLDFTRKAFHKTAIARQDTMRYRISILLCLLFAQDNDKINNYNSKLNASSREITRHSDIIENGYKKYVLLKDLTLCLKGLDYDKDIMKKLCLLYEIDYSATGNVEQNKAYLEEKILNLVIS